MPNTKVQKDSDSFCRNKRTDEPNIPAIKRIQHTSDGKPCLNMSSYATAFPWHGKPVRESWYY